MTELEALRAIADAVRVIYQKDEKGYARFCDALWRLRAFDAAKTDDGWRPIETVPLEGTPIPVEFYMGNWPTGHEGFQPAKTMSPYWRGCWRLKRAHGYWDGATWRHDGTNHEVFEFPDMTDNHPTHWRLLPPPPRAREGDET